MFIKKIPFLQIFIKISAKSCEFGKSTCIPSINNRFCEVLSDGTDFILGSWKKLDQLCWQNVEVSYLTNTITVLLV